MDEVYQTLSLNKLENILDFIVSYTIYTKQNKAELSLDNFVRDFVNITVADVYPEWIDYVSMTTIPETSVFNFSLNISGGRTVTKPKKKLNTFLNWF